MKLLDKYIIKGFLGTHLFSLIAFCAIYVIIDFVGFVDKFIDQNVGITIIVKYYLFYLPYIIILILPVATLLASLFSIGQLSRYSELIAIQAAGQSLYRILAPVFILGIVISLLSAYMAERVVPYTNQIKKEIYNTNIKKNKKRYKTQAKDISLQIAENQWLIIGYFDTKINTAHRVSIQKYDQNVMVHRIDAPKMEYQDEKWILQNGFIRNFSGMDESIKEFETLENKNIQLLPEDIAKVQKKHDEMSYWELKKFIQEIRDTGGNPDRWLVDLYLKIAFPFANFIIILFGAPLASQKTRSGTAKSFGISLFFCFIYFGLIKTGQSLGHNGALPPLLAAWIGNIFFSITALFILVKSNQ